MEKLNVKALGMTLGLVCGICVLALGIIAMVFNRGTMLAAVLSSVYIGYNPTLLGSVIGGIWGFVDGAIGGIVIAWLYNKFAK